MRAVFLFENTACCSNPVLETCSCWSFISFLFWRAERLNEPSSSSTAFPVSFEKKTISYNLLREDQTSADTTSSRNTWHFGSGPLTWFNEGDADVSGFGGPPRPAWNLYGRGSISPWKYQYRHINIEADRLKVEDKKAKRSTYLSVLRHKDWYEARHSSGWHGDTERKATIARGHHLPIEFLLELLVDRIYIDGETTNWWACCFHSIRCLQ